MELGAIQHRSAFTDCYALNEHEIVINLRTGKDITGVSLYHEDPFAGGVMGFREWSAQREEMTLRWELKYHNIWSITLRPKFKREQYYFSVSDGRETLFLFEDGFYTQEQLRKPGLLKQYYRFPWLNLSDVCIVPDWVRDTIWYQIMPDRFCRADLAPKRNKLRKWTDNRNIHYWDFYGGDLKGITEKLPYLQELGISGIYLTPIFLSSSNHKYNTYSYETIDPDFGTEADLMELVETAHSLGIRVMLDAVFNHSGTEFAPWQDVVEKGPASAYWDWFFVNKWPLPKTSKGTQNGNFYSFAFTSSMPKLNTNNPEVADYFLRRCRYWAEHWKIDGIRFDVGNEVSHSFLKHLHRGLKAVNPDLFLLGEIWNDSIQWLQGDEYDSVMNYPFLESIHNFWLGKQGAKELMYALNRCYTLYPEQVNGALFNFLDTHDTMRVATRCGDPDVFFQQLTLLMTLPGSACMYYGTEIALEGGNDPDCRRPMPWQEIERGDHNAVLKDVHALIALRNAHPQLRRGRIHWLPHPDAPRMIRYQMQLKGYPRLTVLMNAQTIPLPLDTEGTVLYSRKLEGSTILPGGIAIVQCK